MGCSYIAGAPAHWAIDLGLLPLKAQKWSPRLFAKVAGWPGRVRGQKLRLLFIEPEELDVGDWRVQ